MKTPNSSAKRLSPKKNATIRPKKVCSPSRGLKARKTPKAKASAIRSGVSSSANNLRRNILRHSLIERWNRIRVRLGFKTPPSRSKIGSGQKLQEGVGYRLTQHPKHQNYQSYNTGDYLSIQDCFEQKSRKFAVLAFFFHPFSNRLSCREVIVTFFRQNARPISGFRNPYSSIPGKLTYSGNRGKISGIAPLQGFAI